MAVSRVASATTAPAGTASFTLTLPSGYATGDRLIAFVGGKYDTTSVPTINQSWTLLKSGTGGTGSTGNDTGTTFWAVFGKDATSGSETAPTVTAGGTAPNSWEAFCVAYRPGMGNTWTDAIGTSATYVQSASDTNTSSPLTATTGSFTDQPTAGDAIAAFGVAPTDLGSALGSTTITATGLSGGTVTTTSGYVENSLGNDTCSVFADWTGFTGTQSAGTALSFTITSATNQSGSVVAVALRETIDPDSAQYVSSSRSGTSDSNAAQNVTPVPSGAAADMVAILAIEIFLDSGSAPITPTWPSGFTGIVDKQESPSNGTQLLVAKKTLTGSDSGNYTTTWSGTRWNQGMCILVDNAGTVLTPDTDSVKSAASGTSITTTSLTSSGKPLLAFFQSNNTASSHTPATGFTELQEGDYITLAARVPLTTGSHSAAGATQSNSTPWAAALIGIEPATGDQAITPQATTVSVTPGSVSLAMSIAPSGASVAVTPGTVVITQPQAVTPAALTVNVTPGTLTVTPGDAPITPAALTVSVTPGSVSLAQSIIPAPLSVSVTPGSLSLAMSIVPQPLTVSVTPGSLSLAMSIAPTGASVSATPGSLTVTQPGAGEQAITPAALSVSVTPGTVTVRREEQITPGALTVSVTPGTLTVVQGQPIVPNALTVSVTPGTLTVAPGPVGITPSPVTVSVTPGSVSVARAIVPQPLTVSVTPGSVSLRMNIVPAAAAVSVTPGSVSLQMSVTPAAVTVSATPGSLTIQVGAAGITPQATIVSVGAGILVITGGASVQVISRISTGHQHSRSASGHGHFRCATSRGHFRASSG